VGGSPQPLGEVIGGERSRLGIAAMLTHGSHFRARGVAGQPITLNKQPLRLEVPKVARSAESRKDRIFVSPVPKALRAHSLTDGSP
jgi:hypothetical protein